MPDGYTHSYRHPLLTAFTQLVHTHYCSFFFPRVRTHLTHLQFTPLCWERPHSWCVRILLPLPFCCLFLFPEPTKPFPFRILLTSTTLIFSPPADTHPSPLPLLLLLCFSLLLKHNAASASSSAPPSRVEPPLAPVPPSKLFPSLYLSRRTTETKPRTTAPPATLIASAAALFPPRSLPSVRTLAPPTTTANHHSLHHHLRPNPQPTIPPQRRCTSPSHSPPSFFSHCRQCPIISAPNQPPTTSPPVLPCSVRDPYHLTSTLNHPLVSVSPFHCLRERVQDISPVSISLDPRVASCASTTTRPTNSAAAPHTSSACLPLPCSVPSFQ
ncbi:mucin-2 [Arachis ipaensis]|uniref:mucin-2 n=1 Tax=Arachis ipaensis TaxID=130454 RepID=UPI0007AFC27C|nr:mucin-2 [Arachis ipaensis]XP_025685281.1 mucin-2 [Arachis hypogaea]